MARRQKIEIAAALAITALALWLQVTRAMHAGGLWRDEAGAVGVALMPTVAEITRVFQHEAFPLLFPLTVRSYAAWAGTSDAAFRVFGLLVGIALFAALWLKALIVDRDVPLLAISLLGVNALAIQWGTTIRGYGLGIGAIVITMCLIWRVATSASLRGVAAALIAAVCSVQIVYANAASLLAIAIAGAVVATRNRHWRRALLILGIGAVAAASLIPYRHAIKGAREWSHIFQVPEYSFASFIARLADAVSASGAGIMWPWLILVAVSVAVAIVVQFWRAPSVSNDRRDAALFCAIILLLSAAAHFAFLRTLSYPTQRWYYLGLIALAAVSIESGFLALPAHSIRSVGRLLAAGVLVLWSFTPAWKAAHLRQTNIDLIAKKLEETVTPGDVVVVMPWFLGVSLRRYYQGSARWMTLPAIEETTMHRYDLLKTHMAASDPVRPVLQAMGDALRSGGRVWVVGSIVYLPDGELPILLAPAPYDSFGWSESAYRESWAEQGGYFLQRNAANVEQVPVAPDVPIMPQEKAQLIVASGWKGGLR